MPNIVIDKLPRRRKKKRKKRAAPKPRDTALKRKAPSGTSTRQKLVWRHATCRVITTPNYIDPAP